MTERGLGRLHAPDRRDRGHLMAATLPAVAAEALPDYRYWTPAPTLDQGAGSSCVGHAWTHRLAGACAPLVMQARMLARTKYLQVLYAVVGLVPVDVVDYLIGAQRPPDVPLHNDTMLEQVPPIGLRQDNVAIRVDGSTATPGRGAVPRHFPLRRPFAGVRTILPFTGRNRRAIAEESATTSQTGTFDRAAPPPTIRGACAITRGTRPRTILAASRQQLARFHLEGFATAGAFTIRARLGAHLDLLRRGAAPRAVTAAPRLHCA